MIPACKAQQAAILAALGHVGGADQPTLSADKLRSKLAQRRF